MLQTKLIQPILIQVLEPSVLSREQPLSVSLVSTKAKKPLLSCISKIARDNALNGESSKTNSSGFILTPKSGDKDPVHSHDENSPLLGGHEEDIPNHTTPPDSAKSRIDELQKEIDLMDQNYEVDYINANMNPVDNLNVLSLLAINDWNETKDHNNDGRNAWQVYTFGRYRLYMHEINSEYALLLCAMQSYPAAAAIGRLENACSMLATKL